MSQPLPSETIEYEPCVDGLRNSNARMLTALTDIIHWAERHGLMKADLITGGQAEVPVITNARAAIAQAEGSTSALVKTIAVHLEGGLVQDVTGIPPGYEVHVHDHDDGDTTHPSWDEEKGCFVMIYEGDGV